MGLRRASEASAMTRCGMSPWRPGTVRVMGLKRCGSLRTEAMALGSLATCTRGAGSGRPYEYC
jgi:hypothetical protein